MLVRWNDRAMPRNAHRFVSSGWSVKQLVRAIALSATYRQSSIVSPDVAHADPDNRLLGHMNRRRLTYEELRDALSFFAGRLASGTQSSTVGLADDSVRTIYEPVDRRQTNVTAAMFDAPDPKAIVPIRAETTTAPQALFVMNDALVSASAKRLATLLAVDPRFSDPERRYNRLWLTLFGRPPAAPRSDNGSA